MSHFNPCHQSESDSCGSCSDRSERSKCSTGKCGDKRKKKKSKGKKTSNTGYFDDNYSKKIQSQFQQCYNTTNLICKGNGLITITHFLPLPSYKITGQTTKSLISSQVIYTAECTEDTFLNLYQINLPDIPVKCMVDCKVRIEETTGEIYTKLLAKYGLTNISSNSFFGYTMCSYPVMMFHVQATCMEPTDFVCRILKVLDEILCIIKSRL